MIEFNHERVDIRETWNCDSLHTEISLAEHLIGAHIHDNLPALMSAMDYRINIRSFNPYEATSRDEYSLCKSCKDINDNDLILVSLYTHFHTEEEIDLVATDLLDHGDYFEMEMEKYLTKDATDFVGRIFVYTGTAVGYLVSKSDEILNQGKKDKEENNMSSTMTYKYYVSYMYDKNGSKGIGNITISVTDHTIDSEEAIIAMAEMIEDEHPEIDKGSVFIIAFSYMGKDYVEDDSTEDDVPEEDEDSEYNADFNEYSIVKVLYKTSLDSNTVSREVIFKKPYCELEISDIVEALRSQADIPEYIDIDIIGASPVGSATSGPVNDFEPEDIPEPEKEETTPDNIDANSVTVYKIEYFDSTDNFVSHKVTKIPSICDLYNIKEDPILQDVVREYVGLPNDAKVRIADVTVMGSGESVIKRYSKPETSES
jgi:hypothetical protein